MEGPEVAALREVEHMAVRPAIAEAERALEAALSAMQRTRDSIAAGGGVSEAARDAGADEALEKEMAETESIVLEGVGMLESMRDAMGSLRRLQAPGAFPQAAGEDESPAAIIDRITKHVEEALGGPLLRADEVERRPAAAAALTRFRRAAGLVAGAEDEAETDIAVVETHGLGHLKCPVTRKYFVRPVRTACGHAFERAVLLGMLERNKGPIRCPIAGCRKMVSAASLRDDDELRLEVEAKRRELG